jgi:nucleoside 2-deoxyribosyltransferase
MKVYLASPFFNDEQIERIEFVESVLEARENLEVFSPRKAEYAPEFGTVEWRDEVFRTNNDYLTDADIVVAIYDGEDSGTMWEIGAAAALDIPVIIFNENEPRLNLMISDSLHAYIDTRLGFASYDFVSVPQSQYKGDVF